MPHVTLQVTHLGPQISALVGVSGPRRAALQKAGQAIPNPVLAQLIVDTGASLTQIDKTIIGKLGVAPSGTSQILTPSSVGGVPHTVNQYDVAIFIPGATAGSLLHSVLAWPVLDGDFSGHGMDGLLGRDILANCRLTYSGPDQTCLLSF